MVPGRSLGKINTLQDLCQAVPLTSTPGPRRVGRGGGKPRGLRLQQGLSCWGVHSGLPQAPPVLTLYPSLGQPH